MMPQMLAARGLSMRSPADGIHYFNAHLMNTEEAGVFLDFPGYLDDQDHVVPLIWNVALWHLVGLDACTEQIPDKLISQLCQGMDLHGNQLIDTAMFSPPLEVILTIHCEVSEAMETHPNVGRQMLHAMVRAVLADIEQNAWLVGDGRGGVSGVRGMSWPSPSFMRGIRRTSRTYMPMSLSFLWSSCRVRHGTLITRGRSSGG